MGTVFVDNLEPQSGTSLTLGASGDTLQVASGVINNLGISQADQWRLTTNITSDTDPITTLERVDEASSGIIGTGMTESSGVFSFPSTGIYLVTVKGAFFADNDTNIAIHTDVDTGSGYDQYDVIDAGSETNVGRSIGFGSLILDITDTSTHKIKFRTVGMGSGNIVFGSTDYNRTAFTFIRLGDT